jgi:hypothetical protein
MNAPAPHRVAAGTALEPEVAGGAVLKESGVLSRTRPASRVTWAFRLQQTRLKAARTYSRALLYPDGDQLATGAPSQRQWRPGIDPIVLAFGLCRARRHLCPGHEDLEISRTCCGSNGTTASQGI